LYFPNRRAGIALSYCNEIRSAAGESPFIPFLPFPGMKNRYRKGLAGP